jgi:hypothetical protein
MANDNIPAPDPEFHTWVVPFSDYVNTNAATLGLAPADIAPLMAAVGTWVTAYPAHMAASASAIAARTNKDQARAAIEGVTRPLIQQLQASPKVTDAQRNSMKINVRSKTRTAASVPTTAPMATVNTSQRLQHTVDFRDSVASGSRKKPAGVASCEIWSKIGAPAPTDISQMTFVTNDTSTPYLVAYSGAQAGLMVCYWLRWVNTRGEKGPWSEPVMATIAG